MEKQQKIDMINYINANGGKARINMKNDTIQKMYDELKSKEVSNMYTQDQVNAMIADAVKAAIEATQKDMMAKFEAMMPKKEEEVKPAAELQPTLEETAIELGLRARYEAIVVQRKEIHAKWMEAIKTRNKEDEKKYEAEYNTLSDERKKLEADPTFRTKCADLLHGTADATRKYGHKAVDAVADVMHKGVDLTAKGIDKLGNAVDKKDRLESDKSTNENVGPADNAGPATA